MDTKQAQINVFTEGLNTDLHPLTTPNNILTDCINGTVITYNGNEFILQNDMGNYKLEKAKLPSDYIPVGVKEYGGIIYIVSYNPIDKLCQIGSYPSPQTLFDNSDDKKNEQDYLGIEMKPLDVSDLNALFNDEIPDSIPKYTKLSELQTLVILMNPEKMQDLYLNPGDKYWLEKNGDESSTWKFQFRKYYSLNEDKKLYDITNSVEEKNIPYTDSSSMSNVTWSCPGWICAKPELYNIDYFNLYITDLDYPRLIINDQKKKKSSGCVSFSIQTQTQIYNKDVADRISTVYSNIVGYKLIYEDSTINDNYWNLIDVHNLKKTEYDNLTIIGLDGKSGECIPLLEECNENYQEVNSSNKEVEYSKLKQIVIKAIPYIQDIKNSENLGYIFDQYTVEYVIDIDDLLESTDIQIFDTYKYLINDSQVNINMSIFTPVNNLSSLDSIKLKIYSVEANDTKNGFKKGTCVLDYNKDLNLWGQNLISLEFDDNFKKENIYILSIESSDILIREQILITSELMNSFYNRYNQYQLISGDEWIEGLIEHLQVGSSTFSSTTEEYEEDRGYFFENSIKSIFDDFCLQPDEDTLFENKNINDIQTTENNPAKKYSGYLKRKTIKGKLNKGTIECDLDTGDSIWSDISYNTKITNNKLVYNTTQGDNNSELIVFDNSWSEDNISIKNLVADGVLIDWEGKIPVVTANRQYLLESIPWYFYSFNNIGNEDNAVRWIPKEPTNKESNLDGWKKLKEYSTIGKYSENTAKLGIAFSKYNETLRCSLAIINFSTKGGLYDGAWSEGSASLFEYDANKENKVTPTFRFTKNDATSNSVEWVWESSSSGPGKEDWRTLLPIMTKKLQGAHLPLFVPILFRLHGNYDGPAGVGFGWRFPDCTIVEDTNWISCGIGVLYYSENIKSFGVALLQLVTPDSGSVGKGKYINGGDVDNSSSTYTTLNTIGKTWFNNNYIASILLAVSLHIYSLKNLKTKNVYLLTESISNLSTSINDVFLEFNREDRVVDIQYNRVSLLDAKIDIDFEESGKYSNVNLKNLGRITDQKIVKSNSVKVEDIEWYTLDSINNINFNYQSLFNFIDESRNKILEYSNVDPSSLLCDLPTTQDNPLYNFAHALTAMLKVHNASSNNNNIYNDIICNKDFTTDDIGGDVAPAMRDGTIGNSILPTISIINESDRITILEPPETMGSNIDSLMQVTQEFKETYKSITTDIT